VPPTSPTATPSAPERRLSFTPRQVLAAALAVFAAVVIAQNRDRVSVNVLFVEVALPLWLMLTATALVGVAIGLLLARRRAKVRRTP
jgi:lipopolysaccharide assembly protein A